MNIAHIILIAATLAVLWKCARAVKRWLDQQKPYLPMTNAMMKMKVEDRLYGGTLTTSPRPDHRNAPVYGRWTGPWNAETE